MTTPSLRQLIVPVRPARSGEFPATWGQTSMYDVIAWMAPDTQYHNILQFVWIEEGYPLPDVLEAIGHVVSGHDSLRTRYRRAPDGTLVQVLDEVDRLEAEIVEASPEEARAAVTVVIDDFERHRFDLGAELPMRVLVGVVDGLARIVVFVVSHQAADALSVRLVATQLKRALAAGAKGRPLPPVEPYRQPVELAAFERSGEGQERNERSLAYWRRELLATPRTCFAIDPVPPQPVQFWRARLQSRAVAVASAVVGRQCNVTSTVAVLAATAVALGHYAGGQERCPIQFMIGNRFLPELRHYVGNITQTLPATVDVRGDRFADVVAAAFKATVGAYQNGRYDTLDAGALRQETAHRRGVDLDLSVYFNDARADTTLARWKDATAEDVRAATEESDFSWVQQWHKENMKCYLHVGDHDGDTVLSMLVDTAYLPPDAAREVLEGIERILVAAATGEQDMARLRALSGIAPVPVDPDRVVVDGCRTDLDATREVLSAAAGGRPAAVQAGPQPDGEHRLVGWVAAGGGDLGPGSELGVEALHDACVERLAGRTTAVAPAWYVLTDGAPDDVEDLDGWAARPVLRAGDGRGGSGGPVPEPVLAGAAG